LKLIKANSGGCIHGMNFGRIELFEYMDDTEDDDEAKYAAICLNSFNYLKISPQCF